VYIAVNDCEYVAVVDLIQACDREVICTVEETTVK
jgi:hypothetical protein